MSAGADRGTEDVPGRVPAVHDHGEHVVRRIPGRPVGHVHGRFGRTAVVPDARPLDRGGSDQFRRRLRAPRKVRHLRQCCQPSAVDRVRDNAAVRLSPVTGAKESLTVVVTWTTTAVPVNAGRSFFYPTPIFFLINVFLFSPTTFSFRYRPFFPYDYLLLPTVILIKLVDL